MKAELASLAIHPVGWTRALECSRLVAASALHLRQSGSCNRNRAMVDWAADGHDKVQRGAAVSHRPRAIRNKSRECTRFGRRVVRVEVFVFVEVFQFTLP